MASDGQEHEANGGMIHLSINFEAAGEIDTVFQRFVSEGANVLPCHFRIRSGVHGLEC
jgi:uncharacterized glyoxalase superfamily protein PhnB